MDAKNLLESFAVLLITGVLTARIVQEVPQRDSFEDCDYIHTTIELGHYDDTTRGLITGYNYYLLQRFASDLGMDIDISISRDGTNYPDSLFAGTTDLVVVPMDGSPLPDSLKYSTPVDSLTYWILPGHSRHKHREMNQWLHDYHRSPDYQAQHDRFVEVFNNPFRVAQLGRKRDHLSPYDDLFKAAAEQLGWDWRRFAAIVYQESKFRIEAQSHKGAAGLMQLMPVTAERFGAEDPLDPASSIEAGTRYLSWLQRIFRRRAADKDNLWKYTLAAYNAGEGHLLDCIHYAELIGVESDTWESLQQVFPDMMDEAILQVDTVKNGTFNVEQMVSYVGIVDSLYAAFVQICPE